MYFYIAKPHLREFAFSSFLFHLGCSFCRLFYLVSRINFSSVRSIYAVQVLFWKHHWPRAGFCPLYHTSRICVHCTRSVGEIIPFSPFTYLYNSESSFLCALVYHVCPHTAYATTAITDNRTALLYDRTHIEVQDRDIKFEDDDCMSLFKDHDPISLTREQLITGPYFVSLVPAFAVSVVCSGLVEYILWLIV